MKTYFDSNKADLNVIIVNDEDRGEVMARLQQNDKDADQNSPLETEAAVPVKCLKCEEPLK